MNRARLAVFSSFALILGAVIVAIFLARGYQVDIHKKSFTSTGILVATSDPDGAEIYINGVLTSATNNSLNLEPATYDILIEKDGYSSWRKEMTIKAGEVLKTNAFLFPKVPDLSPISFSGASNPTVSPDGTKVAFTVASASGEKNGIWILDMSRGLLIAPLISGGDLKQIYQNTPLLSLSNQKLLWGSSSKELIAYSGATPSMATPSSSPLYLLKTEENNQSPQVVNAAFKDILSSWEEEETARKQAQLLKLPPSLQNLLATAAANISFAPDESKVLYEATSSANVPIFLTSYLPGRNPTQEQRSLTPGGIYVYDLKEDKNYQITNCELRTNNCHWFPSSRHLLTYTDREIALVEFDGTNKSVIFGGEFTPNVVFSWPNWSKIVILTSFGGNSGNPNLYTINLR